MTDAAIKNLARQLAEEQLAKELRKAAKPLVDKILAEQRKTLHARFEKAVKAAVSKSMERLVKDIDVIW